MEKKTIRSGAPYVTAGLAVFAVALVLGIGSLLSYGIAAAAGALGFLAGRRLFPDRVVEIERAPRSGNAEVDALIAEARGQRSELVLREIQPAAGKQLKIKSLVSVRGFICLFRCRG